MDTLAPMALLARDLAALDGAVAPGTRAEPGATTRKGGGGGGWRGTAGAAAPAQVIG